MRRRTSYNDYMSYYSATSEALALDSHRQRQPLKEFEPQRIHKGKKRPVHRKPSAKEGSKREPVSEGALRKPSVSEGAEMDPGDKSLVSRSKTTEKRNRLTTPKKRKQVVYVKAISNIKFFS